MCAWEGRKLEGAAALGNTRGRARKFKKFGLCECGWCLRSLGESATVSESGSEGASTPADPLPYSTRTGGAAA